MHEIPPIHRQVNACATLLGEAVSHTHGKEGLALVENIRKQAAGARGVTEEEAKKQLFRLLDSIESLAPQQTLLTAKAFSHLH